MITFPAKRRGYSLIEMHAVMTGLMLVLLLSALLIHQSLRVDRGERARMSVGASLERLAHDFRSDLHDSSGPIDRQDGKLTLPVTGSRKVEYLVRDTDLLRTVIVDGKPKGHEVYARPKGTTAKFIAQPNSVAIVIQNAPGKGPAGDAIYRDYRIEAHVGRHAKLAGAGGTTQ